MKACTMRRTNYDSLNTFENEMTKEMKVECICQKVSQLVHKRREFRKEIFLIWMN